MATVPRRLRPAGRSGMDWMQALALTQRIVITAGGLGVAVFGCVRGAIALKQIGYAWQHHRETGEWTFDSAVSNSKAQLNELRAIRAELLDDTGPSPTAGRDDEEGT